MAGKRTYQDLKAELAEANRTIRELEDENEELQDRLDEIAGIAAEDDDEEAEGEPDDEEAVEVDGLR